MVSKKEKVDTVLPMVEKLYRDLGFIKMDASYDAKTDTIDLESSDTFRAFAGVIVEYIDGFIGRNEQKATTDVTARRFRKSSEKFIASIERAKYQRQIIEEAGISDDIAETMDMLDAIKEAQAMTRGNYRN